MLEIKWAIAPLGGVPMEKINLPFFYQLGSQLNPLTRFTPDESSRVNIYINAYTTRSTVRSLLDTFSVLTVCRAAGEELIKACNAVQDWIGKTPSDKWETQDYSANVIFRQVIEKGKQFETVLSAELQTLATYHVTQKGIYSTTSLIEGAEKSLPEHALGKIDKYVIEEIRQSGRCLAFDVATASAFHMMRATESVMHKYYLYVCKPSSKKKLGNWGAYIAKLAQSQDPEVKEVVAMLQQIKDRHRNLIMHPEIVLSPDEAFTLFEIAQGALIAMADKLPANKKK